MAMDAYPTRPVTQRKRSYSTTAYSSQEEESLSNSNSNVNSNTISQAHSSNYLAVAVGLQVLTYEYRNTDPVISSKSQPPPVATLGQYEGIQISNERVPTGISSLKWSPDNTILAVEAQDGRIFLNDNRGRFQEFLVNEAITEVSKAGLRRCAMSWAPKPQRLYFAMGNKVMTWDSTFKRTAETFEMASRINTLSVNADDVLLAAAQNSGSLDVVNRTTGVSAKLETPPSLVLGRLEYSSFSRSILGGVGNDGILRLWDTGSSGSNAVYHSFTTAHESPIGDMAFSPFNRYLICTAGLDKRYALYDVEKKKVVKNTMADYPLTSVSFKSDGISMAFGTDNGKVLLYDLRSTNRPISIIETGTNAAVTAIEFQGKQSSMKRHQTINGHTLKRQNSAGSQSSVFSMKDSIVFPASTSSSTEALNSFKATAGAAKHSLSRTATFSHPTSQTSSNGSSKATKEPSSLSVSDFFSPRRSSSALSSSYTNPAQDEKPNFKPRRPIVSTTVSVASGQTSASSNQGTPKTTSFPSTYPMPTTPTKERSHTPLGGGTNNNGNANTSHPNSRTESPFSFQMMQSRSPSGESSSSSSSVNNTPPGSPGMEVDPSAKENNRKHHHYHYHSSDSLTKSPSRASRAKRRKSFGTLMASGGVSSMTGTPDPMSEEKVEMLRGQLVDQVREVLLDRPTKLAAKSSIERTSGRSEFQFQKPVARATLGSTSTKPNSTMGPKPKASVGDLWMQAGRSNSLALGRSVAAEPSPSIIKAGSTSSLSSTTAIPSDSFSSKVLENVIEGCLMDLRAGIRNDIQNMHLELLRQFQIQKVEIEGLLKKYADVRELQEENEKLIEENRRLRMNI
ncbi:Protein nedd1 [Entomortierella beljakovae]|nr:Protein nedd1 [Entomortierella beljakovae]